MMIHIAVTHCYKLESFFTLIFISTTNNNKNVLHDITDTNWPGDRRETCSLYNFLYYIWKIT